MPSKPSVTSLSIKRQNIIFISLAIFLILLGVTIFLSYRYYSDAKALSLKEDAITANLISLVLEEHIQKIVRTMESYSNSPQLVRAVKNRNVEMAKIHLAGLVKSDPDMDILVITDKGGTLWAVYPERPESMGLNLAYRDWYKGVSRKWKPYVSDVVLRVVADRNIGFQIAVPVFDESGSVIGILVTSQRTTEFAETMQRIGLEPGAFANITDRNGRLVYSGRFAYEKEIVPYPFHFVKEMAVAEKSSFLPVEDPYLEGRRRYVTYAPVASLGWSVFVERDSRTILMSGLTYYLQTAAIALLLFMGFSSTMFYFRRQAAAQRLLEQLEAEKEINAGEKKLLALSLRHEATLAAVPEIIMEVDNNKIYTWANSAGCEFFGEDVVGKAAAFYFEGEQETYDIVMPLFIGTEDIVYLESLQRRRDGEKRMLAWWCRVLKDEDGNVTGALSSARDITDRKQAEEKIITLNAELEQRVIDRTVQLEAANKELEAFSYSVSHDLRGPLRAIDGFSRILLEDYRDRLDAEGKRLLSIISTNTRQMDQLITELLDLSRVSKSELKFSRIDMTQMAHSIYHEIAPPEVREKFVFTVAPLPNAVGDPTLLRQAWSNLLSNAVKFSMFRDERRIEITGHAEKDMNIYCVRDTGVGFNPDYISKLFGVFQRLHKTSEFEGVGVGLAIVQRIVHRHGGRVWAEGKINEGANFSFSLPIKEANHE